MFALDSIPTSLNNVTLIVHNVGSEIGLDCDIREFAPPDNSLGLDWSQFLDRLSTSEVHEIVPDFTMGCCQHQPDRLRVPSPENTTW